MEAFIALIKTMRPKQWTKNILFVFPGIVFAGRLTDGDALLRVIVASLLLILMSGTVYIINDLVDIEKDRQHPKKKNRPLPSGKLPIRFAQVMAVLIPTVTISIAIAFDSGLAAILVLYLVIQIAYSFSLKHIVILDVLTVTSGFVLRMVAGVVVFASPDIISPWLYACSALLALFLAVGKRRQELVTLGENAVKTRPIFEHYNLQLLDDMLRFVTTSTFITYLLYTIEADTIIIEGNNSAMLTLPFVMYGLFRYLYLIYVKGEGSAPDEVLLTDRPLQITMALWGITFVLLLYVLPKMTL